MQQTTVDGVTTLWEPAPGPFIAALVVGMGARDETFTTSGVTHLIEHITMATIGPRPVHYNAQVSLDTAVFYARGDRPDVLRFLHDVCRALSAPDLHRLPHEAKVIEIEGGTYTSPTTALGLMGRYGMQGPGLSATPEPSLSGITGAQVLDLLGRLVHADNAVVLLTGEPGPDVSLPLPRGQSRRLPPVAPLNLPYPAVDLAPPEAGVVASFVTARSAQALGAVLQERLLARLRFQLGISYVIDVDEVPVGDGYCTIVQADHAEESGAEVARIVAEEIRVLATRPPTDDERHRLLRVLQIELSDVANTTELLADEAERLLRGHAARTPQERLAEFAGQFEREAWGQLTYQAAASLLVQCADHEDPRIGLPLRELPDYTSTGTAFPRRLTRVGPVRVTVHAGPDGVSITGFGETVGAAWSDVVGMGRHQDRRFITTRDGRDFGLDVRDFRHGDQLRELLDSHGRDVAYDDPSLAEDD